MTIQNCNKVFFLVLYSLIFQLQNPLKIWWMIRHRQFRWKGTLKINETLQPCDYFSDVAEILSTINLVNFICSDQNSIFSQSFTCRSSGHFASFEANTTLWFSFDHCWKWFSFIIVESDSSLTVSEIKQSLLLDIVNLASLCTNCSFVHMRKNANKLIHNLQFNH